MRIANFLKGEKGSSIIIFATAIILIMGCAAISVDIGLALNQKAQLANATDAAALAGAQELLNNTGNATAVVQDYLRKNGQDSGEYEIKVLDDNKSMSVTSKKEIPYYFARAFGVKKGEVNAKAVARLSPVTKVNSGARPFAVVDQTLVYGSSYVLKEGAGGGTSGNYGLLALGGTGSRVVENNIISGYDNSLQVGDYVDTEPGNKNGPVSSSVQSLIDSCRHTPRCTYQSYQPDCPRIITVVIVDTLDVSGRKQVRIDGFASFFLEDVDQDAAGHTEIKGRFIKNVIADGDTSDSQVDYGLEGIKLAK